MSLVLDAGALVGYEREDRTVQAFLERARRSGTAGRTSVGVVAQVWRSGSRLTNDADDLHVLASVSEKTLVLVPV